jgi:hypothetical protein
VAFARKLEKPLTMNLFHNPSISDLSLQIERCPRPETSHHLLVDHDGEVLIEPVGMYSPRFLSRFRFYFAGMQGNARLGYLASRNLKYVNRLFKDLLFCWDTGRHGKVDYQIPSKNQLRRSAVKRAVKTALCRDKVDIVSAFLHQES